MVSPGGREQRGFLCPGLREETPLAFPTYPTSVAAASPFLPRHITEGNLEPSWRRSEDREQWIPHEKRSKMGVLLASHPGAGGFWQPRTLAVI